MELKVMEQALTVCKVRGKQDMDWEIPFYFAGRTDEEFSLVCPTEYTPANTVAREDGWSAFRIQGVLDFSLVGILSKISGILADHKIGIFAVSTYNTDYVLVKTEDLPRAKEALSAEGYRFVE